MTLKGPNMLFFRPSFDLEKNAYILPVSALYTPILPRVTGDVMEKWAGLASRRSGGSYPVYFAAYLAYVKSKYLFKLFLLFHR